MHIITNNISPKYLKSWDNFIKAHPHNTVFQSPEMYEFYNKVDNFDPFLFYAENDGQCVGVLLAVVIKEGKGLKGYFSSRAVIYGGPLINNNKEEVLSGLLATLVKTLKNKTLFIQFRNFFEWDKKEMAVFKQNGFIFRERLNLLVDTTDEQQLWAQIKPTRRRQIRKGLKSGATLECPANINEMEVFYKLLVDLYKNKIKKPLPSWSFFKTFYQMSTEGKLGIVKLVKYHNIIVGGILSPVTQNKNVYEWYIVGLDREFKNNYPSVLATWAPLKYALEKNLKYFDFMGLGVPDKEYGVREFKMKFGNHIVNYGRFAKRNNKLLYAIAEFGYNLLSRIK